MNPMPTPRLRSWMRPIMCLLFVSSITSLHAQTDDEFAGDRQAGTRIPAGEAFGVGVSQTERVFWGNQRGEVFRANIDGTQVDTISTSTNWYTSRNAFAVDHDAKMIWFGAFAQVYRCAFDGSHQETVITYTEEPFVNALAIDPVHRILYIARAPKDTQQPSKIDRVNLDDANLEPVTIRVEWSDFIQDIGVDPIAQRLYWLRGNPDYAIKSADLDAANAVSVVDGLDSPHSLAVHPSTGDLFWANFGEPGLGAWDGSIQRSQSPLFSSVETLVTGLNDAYEVTFDIAGQHVYFVDNYRVLKRSSLDGTDQQTLFTLSGGEHFAAVAIAVVGACPPGTFSVTGDAPCTPCPVGTYQPDVGMTDCLPCPAGTAASLEGSALCPPCQTGTYQPLPGQAECVDCPCHDANPCTANDCEAVSGDCQYSPLPDCSIPTVSEWGLVILSALLGTAGTLLLRRRAVAR